MSAPDRRAGLLVVDRFGSTGHHKTHHPMRAFGRFFRDMTGMEWQLGVANPSESVTDGRRLLVLPERIEEGHRRSLLVFPSGTIRTDYKPRESDGNVGDSQLSCGLVVNDGDPLPYITDGEQANSSMVIITPPGVQYASGLIARLPEMNGRLMIRETNGTTGVLEGVGVELSILLVANYALNVGSPATAFGASTSTFIYALGIVEGTVSLSDRMRRSNILTSRSVGADRFDCVAVIPGRQKPASFVINTKPAAGVLYFRVDIDEPRLELAK